MDPLDSGVPKELEGLLDCLDFQEHQDFLVYQDKMVHLAHLECRAAMGRRVSGDTQVVEGSPGHKDYRVHLVCQGKRETQVI